MTSQCLGRLSLLPPQTLASPAAGPAEGAVFSLTRPRDYAGASDDQLLAWSANRDRRAFDEIVVRHGPFALRVARRLIADAALAEDLVQEAMVRAWTRAGQFDPRRARFTTWLYRIVVNLCIDEKRKIRPEPIPESFDPPDPAIGALETMAATQRGAALADALRALPDRQRAAVTLVYDEGMSGVDAARILGVSPKAVERLLARARLFLRGRLTSEHGDLSDVDA